MIQILDEQVKKTQSQIKKEHPNCKYLLLMEDIIDEDGYLYAISTDENEHTEFCDFWHRLVDKECTFRGLSCVLCGDYFEPTISSVFLYEGDLEDDTN